MKRVLCLLLAVAVVFSGCSEPKTGGEDVSETTEEVVTVEETGESDNIKMKLDSGFYVVDMGQGNKPELYIFDKDNELVVDMWFDSINNGRAVENLYIDYSAYLNEDIYHFEIRENKLLFRSVSVKTPISLWSYGDSEPFVIVNLENNDLSVVDEYVILAQRATDYLINFEFDSGLFLESIFNVIVLGNSFSEHQAIKVVVYTWFQGEENKTEMCVEFTKENNDWIINKIHNCTGGH